MLPSLIEVRFSLSLMSQFLRIGMTRHREGDMVQACREWLTMTTMGISCLHTAPAEIQALVAAATRLAIEGKLVLPPPEIHEKRLEWREADPDTWMAEIEDGQD